MSARLRNELVLATSNQGKVAELRRLLAEMAVEVKSICDVLSSPVVVVEDGDTFEENAKKKARATAAATHRLTLADDSGLEVDALDGRPGVRSARFAGEGATDAENNAALLRALQAYREATPAARDRPLTARFRCALALVDPSTGDGKPLVVLGTCEGVISLVPRGSGGFGYDPLFLVDGTGLSLAELGEGEKNRVSHRAQAVARLKPILEQVLAARTEGARANPER